MKIIFFLVFALLIFSACGKKSDPKYQANINQPIKNVS